jgi:DNA recombination protein RmuC
MPIVTLVLLVVVVTFLLVLLVKTSKVGSPMLDSRLDAFEKAQERTERAVREEVAQSRDELGKAAREQRKELTEAFKVFGDSFAQRMVDVAGVQKAQLDAFSEQLTSSTKLSAERLDGSRTESTASAKQLREEVVATLTSISDTTTGTMREWANIQKTQLDAFSEQLASFARASGTRLDGVRAESATGAKQLREEVVATLNGISETITNAMSGLASAQKAQFEGFASQLASFAQTSGEKLDGVRGESATGAKQLREEVVSTLNSISETMINTTKELAVAEKIQLEEFSGHVASFTKTSGEKLDGIRTESAIGGKQLRQEVIAALTGITDATTKTMGELANVQKGQLETMSSTIAKLSDSNEKKLEAIRLTVEGELRLMQADNARQLEQMRQTVDEKLQGTLEKRLGESFKQVSERLEQVHKGLGEMQTLATGVGDLKKVLTNVKTRGTWGEVQLGALLEQVLSPDQFAANVSTKDAGERVEFAVRLPGQGTDKDETVWLPIDAKFPVEDYQRLTEAQERADVEGVESAGKQLETRVKACARTISEKYLNPPKTTDFGVLFLPTEGLFAEVIRRTGLIETIQRESRVIIAGPTTLWSILNSLQMGFRTLAIQKRSSEVWNLLAAVKTEWMKYGEVLEAVQRKLHQASDTIEKAKVRSRAIGRKLSDVQELPADDAKLLLPNHLVDDDTEKLEADEAEEIVMLVPLSPDLLSPVKH